MPAPLSSIAVIGGTGRHGRGLARCLAAARLHVIVGSRDPARAARSLDSTTLGAIETAGYGDAIARADVVILAVPFASVRTIVADHRHLFRPGALVVDVTVPVTFSDGRMTMIPVPEGSAAEHVRNALPPEVRLAASFKTIPAHLLEKDSAALDCDEFVCGDSEEARARASELVRVLPGVRPIDVGPLESARSIEHATALAIAINRRHRIHDARFRVIGL